MRKMLKAWKPFLIFVTRNAAGHDGWALEISRKSLSLVDPHVAVVFLASSCLLLLPGLRCLFVLDVLDLLLISSRVKEVTPVPLRPEKRGRMGEEPAHHTFPKLYIDHTVPSGE